MQDPRKIILHGGAPRGDTLRRCGMQDPRTISLREELHVSVCRGCGCGATPRGRRRLHAQACTGDQIAIRS